MNSEEIRNIRLPEGLPKGSSLINWACDAFCLLREIAAQLAEINERAKK